jgi:hypothetical protein
VFSCYTGLSYTDVQHLQKADIVQGNDGKLWILASKKDLPDAFLLIGRSFISPYF